MKKSLLLSLIAILVVGCTYSRQIYRRSNVMDYLYPEAEDAPKPVPSGAVLKLPLDIGIAFVPATPAKGAPHPGQWHPIVPAETEERLLGIVKQAFADRDWVGKIETIPSTYLVPGGGFDNLQQIGRMFDVDIIALASVDQVQNSDPHELSFLYLSVIGAYTLPLDVNETRTLIDVAAFHVPTRTFLLRAPGLSRVKGRSAAVTVDEALRHASRKGFEEAMEAVAGNLDSEIDAFREEIASGQRGDVEIVTREGGHVSQGAAVDWKELMLALLLGGVIIVGRRSWISGV